MALINFPSNPIVGQVYYHKANTPQEKVYTYLAGASGGSSDGYWGPVNNSFFGPATTAQINSGSNTVQYVAPYQLRASDYIYQAKLDARLNKDIPFAREGRKNLIINGDMRVNQRGFDGNYLTLVAGVYGYDRWMKINDTTLRQYIESGSFKNSTYHVLSGTNVATQVIYSPAAGHWAITVPVDATDVQLEERGDDYQMPTKFEVRPFGVEMALCQRYFEKSLGGGTPGVNPSYNEAKWCEAKYTSTNIKGLGVTFAVRKYISPVMTAYNPHNAVKNRIYSESLGHGLDVSSIISNRAQVSLVNLTAASPGNGSVHVYSWHWTAEAEIFLTTDIEHE